MQGVPSTSLNAWAGVTSLVEIYVKPSLHLEEIEFISVVYALTFPSPLFRWRYRPTCNAPAVAPDA